MRNIKHIVFDFDGVLIDSMDLLLKTHNENLGPFSEEEHKELFQGNAPKKLKEYTDKQVTNFLNNWEKALKNKKITNKSKKIIEKIFENNKKIHIITSNSEKNILNILNNSNSINFFENIYGRETSHSKVKKFKILQNKYNLNFNEVIFITDSSGDLKEASEFPEIKTIGVTFGIHCRETLEKENPDFIVYSWEEINKILFPK